MTPLVFRSARSFAVPAAFATGVALFAHAALMAQNVPEVPPQRESENEPEISLDALLVTGSAVPVQRGKAFQPLSTLESEEIARVGAGNLAEGLRSMPFVFGNLATEQRSNGGTGAAGVNLRGLGGTLTLLDGHRTAGFDEVNLIPVIAVDKVEIVKDGAGARYGADALTGVFNPMLVRRYRGAKVDLFYGNTTDTDAGLLRAGLLAGAGNANTDIVLALETYDRNALMARDRDVSADADGRSRGGQNLREQQVSTEMIAARPGDTAYQYLVLPSGVSAGFTAATFVPYNIDPYTSTQMYNARELTPSIPAQKNESVYARINHRFGKGDWLEAYARFLYSHNEYESAVWTTAFALTGNELRASPHRPTGLIIPAPGLSSAYDIGAAAYLRPDSIGLRGRIYERDVYDFQAGLKGQLGGGWSWDATYVYSWWYRDDLQTNALNIAGLRAAVASGAYNIFAMDSAAGVNPNNGLPFDNPAALRSVAEVGRVDLDVGLRGGDIRIGGPIVTIVPGKIEFAAGYDYYVSEQSIAPDSKVSTGVPVYYGFNRTGFSSSGYTSQGAFAELIVPVVGPGMDVPLVRSLAFSGSVRHSEKEIEGTVPGTATTRSQSTFKATTPKVAVRYEPVRDLALRASYAEGFRTPALSYFYAAPSTGTQSLSDPLGFTTASSISVTTQGNPNLQAEESRTWSTGVVYKPRAIRGLKLEAEYYDSRIENMAADGAQLILNINAAAQGPGFVRGNPATINPSALLAGSITRNSVTGALLSVRSSPVNVAEREATGVEYALVYEWPEIDGAKLTSRLEANTTLTWDLRPAANLASQNWLGRYVDIASNAISPGSIPRHRGRFIQGWEKNGLSFFGTINHVTHLEDDTGRTYRGTFRYVSSWTTIDAQVSYAFKSTNRVLGGLKIRVGVTNIGDREAPFAAGAFNDGYDVTTHSNRGRFVYTQITKTF